MPRDPVIAPPLTDQIARLLDSAHNPGAIAVLGDALQELGDPRGELIALGDPANPTLHAGCRTLLDAGVGRMWLGSFAPHIPRSAVRYHHGIPSEIGLWIEPGQRVQLDLHDPLPWAFGPRVRFLPTSARPIWPRLATVRALGPVDSANLVELAATATPFGLAELELELFDAAEDLALLFALDAQLPHLRTLRLTGLAATPDDLLAPLRGWSRLASLARLDIACVRTPEVHVADLIAWHAARLPCPVAITMYDADGKCASGWSITVGDGDVVVERIGYLRDATPELLDRLVAALPRARVVRRAGPYWSPP